MTFIILLVAVGVISYRITSREQREHALGIAIATARQLRTAAAVKVPEHEAFRAALRARSRYVFVVPAIALIFIAVVVGMLLGKTPMSDPNTLFVWGASLGTRTTNGEWWRLATAIFVHVGLLHLLIDLFVLVQLGGILERLVGRLTFAAAYLSAGVFTGLVNLSSHPIDVTVSPSGAIFGLYGLLLASLTWQAWRGWRRDPAAQPEEGAPVGVVISRRAMKRLAVGGAVFFVYSAFAGFAHAPEFTGFALGLAAGLVLARGSGESLPNLRDVAVSAGVTVVIAILCAIGLRNIADVKPEIARVVATELRTAAEYQKGADGFRRGRVSAEALAQLAEGTIPQLQTEDARLKALYNVPPEHQGLVADAREYLRLRCESWRARAAALRKTHLNPHRAPDGPVDVGWRLQAEARFRSNLVVMGAAEGAERASLEAFQRIRQ